MKKQHILGAVLIAIFVSGIAFYGGILYAKKQSPQGIDRAALGGRQGGTGQQRAGFSRTGTGMTIGEILSKDDLSMTVKLPDGGSKIIFYGSSTAILKTASGTPADLVMGINAVISGTANQDGSITASTVQLRTTQPGRRTVE